MNQETNEKTYTLTCIIDANPGSVTAWGLEETAHTVEVSEEQLRQLEEGLISIDDIV